MSIRVLIIDDSPFARKIIQHHLQKCGCQIVGEAENAAQALKLFRDLKPDLVTLDVMMPECNGIDSLRAFRLMRNEVPNVQIIVVSSVPFEKTRNTFLEEGALAYIVKPFNQYSLDTVRRKLTRVFPELSEQAFG